MRLIESLESAPVTVVGVVQQPRAVDRHGWTAELQVETPLVGHAKPRQELAIAWEELAASRAARFRHGDRILVSLEPLPGQSIWRQRFPDPERRASLLSVAEAGDAFLRDPTLGGVLILEHYARLGRDGRESSTGVGYLVELASGAQPPLALSAVERLGGMPGLSGLLPPDAGEQLVALLLRPDLSDALRDAVLDLIGRRQLEAARPALEREAARGEAASPVVFLALGRLDGELPAERVAWLLERGPASYRLAAARYASGPEAPGRLRALLLRDADPAVRAAAVTRLVSLQGAAALSPAIAALSDSDDAVRQAALQALGSLGAAAVPALTGVVERGEPEAARAAVASLLLTNSPEAERELRRIAETHESEAIRLLAKIALAQPIGESHAQDP